MSCMNGKTFVDTNVLIYAHDVDAKGKHHAARAILAELWSERSGVVSMQVLQEFYVNATRKIAHPLPKESGRLVVSTYAVWCVDTTPVSYTHLRAHETDSYLVCRLLLEKKKNKH